MDKYIKTQLNQLFDQASKNGGIEYIYTLLRVTGIGEGPDELIHLYKKLETYKPGNEILTLYRSIVNSDDLFVLLVNLVNCTNKGKYSKNPLLHLYNGGILSRTKPSALQIVRETASIVKKLGGKRIAEIILKMFPNEILLYLINKDSTSQPSIYELRIKECCDFTRMFLRIYFEERLRFNKGYKIYKLPRFEVLELLTDGDYGLFGFYMHFSNDTSAHFIRHPDNTDCLNLSLTPVNFFVGELEKLKNEWRMHGKRLYEVGLPGRYNKLGEWKPLVYPVSSDDLQAEALSVSDNGDVQSAYFYMLCTGYKLIEFVVRTTLELPNEFIHFGSFFHLQKCTDQKGKKGISETNNFIQIYDGWIDLEYGSVEEIDAAIRSIGLALNIIGFTYGVPIDWRIKYKMFEHVEPVAVPTKEDLEILDTLLKSIPYDGNDAVILSYAIDWYVKGRTSKNIFLRFLSYYISFESIALAIAKGDADFGLEFQSESKADRKQKRKECIEHKFEILYTKSPVQFVQEAYYECVEVSIKTRTRIVVEFIFGPANKYIELLFKKTAGDDTSLNDIRGRLAHGDIAILEREDERLVRNHIHEIETIAKEFLMRIILKIKPEDPLPSWSYEHKAAITSVDPRSTLCCSDLKIFPKGTDWKIRAEWCD